MNIKSFSHLPAEIVKMIVSYEMDTLKVTLEDLGSLGNTYVQLRLPERQLMRREEVFILEKAERVIGTFEVHYFHEPEGSQMFDSPSAKLAYFAAKTQRLFNLIRNTHRGQCFMEDELLKASIYDTTIYNNPANIIALNEILYNRYFVVVAYNFRSYVWIGISPGLKFEDEGFVFYGEVQPGSNRVRISSPQKLYNSLCIEKEGQAFKPSLKYPIRAKERVILADAKIFDISVTDCS